MRACRRAGFLRLDRLSNFLRPFAGRPEKNQQKERGDSSEASGNEEKLVIVDYSCGIGPTGLERAKPEVCDHQACPEHEQVE